MQPCLLSLHHLFVSARIAMILSLHEVFYLTRIATMRSLHHLFVLTCVATMKFGNTGLYAAAADCQTTK